MADEPQRFVGERQQLEHIHGLLHEIKDEVANRPILARIEAMLVDMLVLIKEGIGDITPEQEAALRERVARIRGLKDETKK